MAVKVYSCLNLGLEGQLIEVEADILNGLSAFSIVGLGDSAVQESKERIRSALKNSGVDYPQQKKVINLAPANLRKHGPQFDLPIALSLLAASGQINGDQLQNTLIIGELALDGSIRPVTGVITTAIFARDKKWERIILPESNFKEASLVKKEGLIPVKNLRETVSIINNINFNSQSLNCKILINSTVYPAPELAPHPTPESEQQPAPQSAPNLTSQVERTPQNSPSFNDIIGQQTAKRALQIAASGGHHICLSGSPGVGKTLLARALTDILPPLTDEEKIEVLQIYSAAGLLSLYKPNEITRPFREVHQSCTLPALYGGGTHMKPGEITLAHRGILFMDELPEFSRAHLEQLRQPMEEKIINISRVNGTVTYPAQFILVAGMNACPCGYFGDPKNECICRPYRIMQYQKKISGPITDRLDMFVEVAREQLSTLTPSPPVSVNQIRSSITLARALQTQRFIKEPITLNSEMGPRQIKTHCTLNRESRFLLDKAAEHLSLSMRKYHQIIRLSRTIADLENAPDISKDHIAEALQYRQKTPTIM